jgi:nitroreductase
MELYDVMRTTFAARQFTDATVSDAQIRTLLENARFAPSGGNRQGWKVIVVREPKTRDALTELMRPAMQRYFAQRAAGENPCNTIHPTRLSDEQIAAFQVPDPMIHMLTRAPALLFVFVDLSVVASFVWNILLAARNEGLGGTITTFVGAREPQLQALLGVPSHMAFAAMVLLGRPAKQLTRLKRKPVDEFACLERFGGAPLGR